MNRFAGAFGALLTCLLVALVAIGCSRSDLDYGALYLDGGGDDAPEGSPPPSCGNHTCDTNESCLSCALDCGQCPTCGNGNCDSSSNESCSNCPQDCGTCSACGDGKCTAPEENCQNCAPDCGACPGCGDGTCTAPNETCFSCPQDCGTCKGCPDGRCEPTETCASCSADCGSCDVCGNGKCEPPYETCDNCPGDCGQCAVKTCFQSLTCVLGCLGGLGGGGFGQGPDGGITLPPNVLTCASGCIANGCSNAQLFLNNAVTCLITNIGTCGGSINCLMGACSNEISACIGSHC